MTLMPSVWSWIPLLTLDIVRWNLDGGTLNESLVAFQTLSIDDDL